MDASREALLTRMREMVGAASSIAICAHTNPDGDALGSELALAHAIEALRPDLRVDVLLADERPAPELYAFLPGFDRLVPAKSFEGTCDLLFVVDTPSVGRLADGAAVLERARASAQIDHHPQVDFAIDERAVDPGASAAGELVLDFVDVLGVPLTRDIATCLLAALVTDTGRFQYQNTSPRCLRAAARLLEAGASIAQVTTEVYQSFPREVLRLQELALSRLACDPEGLVAYSYVTFDDLCAIDAQDQSCDSLVDLVRSLAGPVACVFMRECADGQLRANLRSKVDWVDVSMVARAYAGGGHRAAAGFSVDGPIELALPKAVAAVVAQVHRDASCAGMGA